MTATTAVALPTPTLHGDALGATAALQAVTGTDLMVVSVLAMACFGLPGVALLLYLRRRTAG